jgi:hypothetical protein
MRRFAIRRRPRTRLIRWDAVGLAVANLAGWLAIAALILALAR